MAFHMDTGKVLWSMQALPFDVWHNGCPQTIPGRAGGAGRGVAGGPGRGAGAPRRQAQPQRRVPRRRAGGAAASRIRRKTVPTTPVPTGISRHPRR